MEIVAHRQPREQNVKHTATPVLIWDSSTLAKHMKTAYGVYISQDKLISPHFPDIFLSHAIANILMIHWNKQLNGIFTCVLCL